MKTKIISMICLFFLSLSLSAQIDRTKQPKPGPAPKINLGKPKTFELKNGLKVLVVENHKLPRVSATLTIDNVPMSFGDKKGVENLLGGMLGTGSTTIPKSKFDEEVDYLGANISFWDEGARASSLSKYFPRVLELMADAAFHPVFSQDEFDKQMKQGLDAIKSSENSVTAIANRVQSALTFGKNHPFGESMSKETLEKVTLGDVKNLYNTYYKPNNAYLIIIGDVKFKDIKKKVKKLFGTWKPGELPKKELPAVTNPSETEIDFIDVPNAVQSEISVRNAVKLHMNDKDYYAALLANQILGGGGTARLFKNLREDKGYTYGAYSRIGSSRYASVFAASAAVRNAVTDSAVVEFVKEIKKIKTTPISAGELKLAKAKYVGNFVRALERPSTIANYALDIERLGLPEDYYENYLKNIDAVTIEDVQKAADKYFKIDNARIVVTGKGVDVADKLEKLGYKVNYFDKYGNAIEKPKFSKPIPKGVTAKTVIENYIKAVGGLDKLKAVASVVTKYEANAMGSTILVEEKRVADKYKNTTYVNGAPMATVVANDTEMYMKQGANKIPMPKAMLDDLKDSFGTFVELSYLNNDKVKLTGIETVEGKDAYIIEVPGKTVSATLFYDMESGLKVKEISVVNMGGRTQKNESLLSEYKEYDGIKFPVKKVGSFGPQKVESTLKEVLINKGVSEDDFK
ncbi:MAG TPA: insulinase family protein [Flavobacteriia bacterium]|nr:insulinase family protein [Flavobacteriia bacterium]